MTKKTKKHSLKLIDGTSPSKPEEASTEKAIDIMLKDPDSLKNLETTNADGSQYETVDMHLYIKRNLVNEMKLREKVFKKLRKPDAVGLSPTMYRGLLMYFNSLLPKKDQVDCLFEFDDIKVYQKGTPGIEWLYGVE